MLATAVNTLVRIFLEPLCAACAAVLDRPLASPVCEACWRAVAQLTPPWCVCCGDALPAWRPPDPYCARCRRRPPVFTLARSAGRYDGSLRQIVHALKYGRRRLLAEPLAALMIRAGPDVLAGADAVVPVPLHPFRAWQRGFNQADDLARALGRPIWRVLRRTRHGPPQAALPAARRHANVRGSFALTRCRGWPAHRSLRGAIVILVDDVMTTGATMAECGRVLKGAGARTVRVLTVARAVAATPKE